MNSHSSSSSSWSVSWLVGLSVSRCVTTFSFGTLSKLTENFTFIQFVHLVTSVLTFTFIQMYSMINKTTKKHIYSPLEDFHPCLNNNLSMKLHLTNLTDF